jgi:hypothetical protein
LKSKDINAFNFAELLAAVNINVKRREYGEIFKAAEKNINNIPNAELTETDSILLEEIPSENNNTYTEKFESFELLSCKEVEKRVSSVSNSPKAKELIAIIKKHANSPIFNVETDLANAERLTLTKAFLGMVKIYIDKADAYGNEMKQTKIQYYTDATKLINYALSIKQDIVDQTTIPTDSVPTLEEINRKLISIVCNKVNITPPPAAEVSKLDKEYFFNLRKSTKAGLELIDNSPDEKKVFRTKELFEQITCQIKYFLAKVYQESELILGYKHFRL